MPLISDEQEQELSCIKSVGVNYSCLTLMSKIKPWKGLTDAAFCGETSKAQRQEDNFMSPFVCICVRKDSNSS